MKKILIKHGEIVQPSGPKGKMDILVEGGIVADIAPAIEGADALEINAKGLIIVPGFVDMHVHLREPGQEYKEDIASGTLAALHGGYTTIACMPNTDPVNDDMTVTSFILKRAEQANNCRVLPIAAITKGLKGEELTEMGMLLKEGVVAFSDDGKPVSNAEKMRLALQYAKNFNALLMQHCEDRELAAEGVMNEGSVSVRIGLKGIPACAESVMVARDIELVREYDGRVHFCHISTAASVELIRRAKAEGLAVSCETAPHYFAANEKWVEERDYDTQTKMNPPLRSEKDVKAIIDGLVDGTIDAIATDHAPHHRDEKEVEFNMALNGIVGLETAFSLGYTHLVKTGKMSFERLVACMSTGPCRVLGIPGGMIDVGTSADITMVDPNAAVTYTEQMLHSKGKNSPFLNREYDGKVVHTMVDGELKI